MFRMEMRVTLSPEDPAASPIVDEIVAGPPDLIRLERAYDIGAPALAATDAEGNPTQLRMEWLVFLAWSALRRRKPGEIPDLEQFVDRLEDLEIKADEETDAPGEANAASPAR